MKIKKRIRLDGVELEVLAEESEKSLEKATDYVEGILQSFRQKDHSLPKIQQYRLCILYLAQELMEARSSLETYKTKSTAEDIVRMKDKLQLYREEEKKWQESQLSLQERLTKLNRILYEKKEDDETTLFTYD